MHERRLLALQAKLAILSQETAAWRADSQGASARFALHKSQIAEVCEDLAQMRQLIADELAALRKTSPVPLADIERLENRILAALQIWDSYRSKWAQRIEAGLRETLNLIDDLAWLAYRPAHDHALDSRWLEPHRARLPPLVFANPRWSPFARAREQGYELDEGSGVLRQIDDFEPYLRCMPVPLIGIPWTQAAHLPDVVFVGHEVGHLIEDDLDLAMPLRQVVLDALPTADEAHRQAWSRHWRSEVFADLWGVLCCGPAFAVTLADLLQGAADVATEAQPDAGGRWGAYPTRALRLQVLVAALRVLDGGGTFNAAAQALSDDWRLRHPSHAMPSFDADVEPVVRALLTTPLKAFANAPGESGQDLLSVLNFSSQMQQDACTDAEQALNSYRPKSKDVRVLFAGMALAFAQSPQGFQDKGAQASFVQRLRERRTQGERAAIEARVRPPAAQRQRAAAEAMFALADRRDAATASKDAV